MKKSKIIWTIILTAYILFIFRNSWTPAEISTIQSQGILAMVIGLFEKFHISIPFLTEHILRKTAHFLEYSLLGVILRHTLSCYREEKRYQRGQDRRQLILNLLNLILGQLIPLVDETIQLFSVGRSGQISDVWLDISGVLFGTSFYFLMIKFSKIVKKS